MTNLPATYNAAVEAEAINFACGEIAYFRNHKVAFVGVDVNCFKKSDSRRFALEMIKAYALGHPTHMMYIVDQALARWDLADEALRELIIQFEYHHREKPTPLADYTMRIAQAPIPRRSGPKRIDYFFRDMVIVMIVNQVRQKFALKETRSSARRASACSVVARAFSYEGIAISEEEVVKIWRRYRKKL